MPPSRASTSQAVWSDTFLPTNAIFGPEEDGNTVAVLTFTVDPSGRGFVIAAPNPKVAK